MFKLLPILGLVALTGCASMQPTVDERIPRMHFKDLNTYQIDCSIKEQQMMMFEGMLPDTQDKVAASITRVFGDPDSYHILDNSYEGVVRMKIAQLRVMCPNKTQSEYERAGKLYNGSQK